MINRYSNALIKIDEYKSLINLNTEMQEFMKQFRLKKKELDNLGSEIDLECETNYKLWYKDITCICNSGVFKSITYDLSNKLEY